MTVETTNTIAGPFLTDGAATAFPFNFKAVTSKEVAVVAMGDDGVEVLVSDTLYRVTVRPQSGTVTFFVPPPAGLQYYVIAKPSFLQGISFSNQSSFLPAVHNEANDRAALRDQVLRADVNRSIRFGLGAEVPPIASPSLNPSMGLGTDADGNLTWFVPEPGKDARPPETRVFKAVAGQRRFPPSPYTLASPPPGYDPALISPATAAVYLNTGFISNVDGSDYSKTIDADGYLAAITFSEDMLADAEVAIGGYLAAGDGGGTSPTPLADEVSLADFPRQAGDDSVLQIGPDTKRMYRMRDAAKAAGKNQFAPVGTYQLWENSQQTIETITGLLGTDDYVLRGAGIDRTIFVGMGDVLNVFYGNKMPRGTPDNPTNIEPNSPFAIKRVELSHFTIRQPGDFLEQSAAIGLLCASHVHLHDLKIEGFNGDALLAGSANFGDKSQNGHNEDWLVERVIVDGLGQANGLGGNNRNGITINDMVRYTERDCVFMNLSRPGNGNQSPEDRTDPNKGPPMPGNDMEFVVGGVFDSRVAHTLVERRSVINCGGAADVLNLATGNRTTPPFPVSGENAADISTLVSDHRRVGITSDRCRLGLMSADAPPDAAVGMGAYYGFCTTTNAGRSYEITRFRGLTMEGNTYYRSSYAGTLGYVIDAGWFVRDFKSLNETWEQCGLTDGLVEGIFQCDGAVFQSPKHLNCNGTGFRLGGQYGRIKNLKISDYLIQNDPGPLPKIAASVLFVPQAGETLVAGINRQLDLKTISITFAGLGGAALPNFAWPGGYSPSAWRYGEWDQDAEVYCSSNDPGAPRGWRIIQANTLPAFPRMIRFGVKGLPSPDVAGSLGVATLRPSADVIVSPANRFESTSANQYIDFIGSTFDVDKSTALGCELIVRGIYDRTSMLFVGAHPGNLSGASLTNFTGAWYDGGELGTRQRVAYMNGAQQTLQGAFFHDQYTRFRWYWSTTAGVPVFRIYTGATVAGPWTPSGNAMALSGPLTGLRGFVLFGSAGESLHVAGYNLNGTGNGEV